jgi:LacI family transcriptional regulator
MSVSRIAEKAGVSIATVSRVLNKSRPVNPRIAELVHQAMRDLQLTANPIRRTRPRGSVRPGTLAIVSLGQSYRGWFEVPVIARAVGEITRLAQDHNMSILMAEMPDPYQLSPVLRRPDVDGALVFMRSGVSAREIQVLHSHLPIVRVLGGQMSPMNVDHVGADNIGIGHLAARYLLDQQLRELCYLTTEPTWDFSKLRAQGFLAAAQEHALSPTLFVRSDGTAGLGLYGPKVVAEQDLSHLVKRVATKARSGRVGIFISRDEETVQIYRLLRDEGIEPGKDVVVISCDCDSVRLSTLHPRPVSIDLQPCEIARHAIRRLITKIKHRAEPPVRILISPRLVECDGGEETNVSYEGGIGLS